MFRITRKTDYATRMLLALARQPSDALVSTRRLQQEMQIPQNLAPQIVAALVNYSLVEAIPGRNGGIRLARPAERINLREVVERFEKNFTLSECVTSPPACPFAPACPVQRRWVELQALLMRELEQTTLAELAASSSIPTEQEKGDVQIDDYA